MAGGYVEKKEDVVNLLQAAGGRRLEPGDAARALRRGQPQRDAGARRDPSSPTATRSNATERVRAGPRHPGTCRPPDFDQDGKLVFSDFLNLFVFNSKNNLGAVDPRAANKGLFQSLAEPNLIADNGKEASFLAGGEYPYPVVQGVGAPTR